MFHRAALCSSSSSVCVSVTVFCGQAAQSSMSTKSKVAPTRNRPAANEDPRATGVSEPRASSSGALEPEGQPYAEAVSTDEDNIAQAQAKTGVSKPSASLSGAIEPDFSLPSAEPRGPEGLDPHDVYMGERGSGCLQSSPHAFVPTRDAPGSIERFRKFVDDHQKQSLHANNPDPPGTDDVADQDCIDDAAYELGY